MVISLDDLRLLAVEVAEDWGSTSEEDINALMAQTTFSDLLEEFYQLADKRGASSAMQDL